MMITESQLHLLQEELLLKKAISLSRLKTVSYPAKGQPVRNEQTTVRDTKVTATNISPVYLLLPLACGKKIWLFKCLRMSWLL